MDRLVERLNGLDAHAAAFHADAPIILKDADYFITEDEIDRMLTGGGSVEYGNYRIYLYFTQPHSAAEKQAFLKNEYGIGGNGYIGHDEWHDGNGITFSRGRMMQPYEKLLIKWPQAAKRIDELIARDRYLTAAQKAHLPEYERQQAEREAQFRMERAAHEAMREAERRMQDARQSAEYAFTLGDTVQIGGDSLTILGYDDETVTLTDPKYPLLSQDMPRDVFERRMRDSRANDHLIVSMGAASDHAHAEAPELLNDKSGTAPTVKQITENTEQPSAEGDEEAMPERTSRDVFNEYSPLFISRVLHDEAYTNAHSNSDEQNAREECAAAVERVMQSIIERSLDDNIELYNHYFDAANGFKQRLCDYVFNKTYTELMGAETLTPLWERQPAEASRVHIDIAAEQPQESGNDAPKFGETVDAYMLSESKYLDVIAHTETPAGEYASMRSSFTGGLSDTECYFIDGNMFETYCKELVGSPLSVQMGEASAQYAVTGAGLHKYIGLADLYRHPTVVVSDEVFESYAARAGADGITTFSGFMFDDEMASANTVDAINAIIPARFTSGGLPANISYIGLYHASFALYGSYVFIGLFIGVLFLLAVGSVLYYKLIMEAQEEIPRYGILRKTGMSKREILESVAKQLGLTYGIPLGVGLVHMAFALLTYNRMMMEIGQETPTLLNALLVVAAFVGVYAIFYAFSVKSYYGIVLRSHGGQL